MRDDLRQSDRYASSAARWPALWRGSTLVGPLHERVVFGRRTRVLADHFARLLPQGARVLDVGCGDGTIDALILARRPDLSIVGIDVMVRPETKIQVSRFDGARIPFDDASFDAVMFIDVLHHTDDPRRLLGEARRVARRSVVLKDHTMDGVLARSTLRLMDWVGNAHHGVVLPYNYWPERSWRDAFRELALTVEQWVPRLGLYPWPSALMFDRGLHFVAVLGKR